MAVYKDNATGTWRVIYRFTNWKGERKQTQKRGFATKREALAWEHEVMLKQGAKLDMTFAAGERKHMGIQKSCNPHKDFTVFREPKDSRD